MASINDVVKSFDDKMFQQRTKIFQKGLSGSRFKCFCGYEDNGTNSASVVLFTGSKRPISSAEQMLQKLMDERSTVKIGDFVLWSSFEFLKRSKIVEEADVSKEIEVSLSSVLDLPASKDSCDQKRVIKKKKITPSKKQEKKELKLYEKILRFEMRSVAYDALKDEIKFRIQGQPQAKALQQDVQPLSPFAAPPLEHPPTTQIPDIPTQKIFGGFNLHYTVKFSTNWPTLFLVLQTEAPDMSFPAPNIVLFPDPPQSFVVSPRLEHPPTAHVPDIPYSQRIFWGFKIFHQLANPLSCSAD